MYCGAQDQYYTYTMFDICGLWTVKLILGDIDLPSSGERETSWRNWVARNTGLADCHEEINFQTEFVMDLATRTTWTLGRCSTSGITTSTGKTNPIF